MHVQVYCLTHYLVCHYRLSSKLPSHLLSAVSLIFTRASCRTPTDAPNCELLLGLPKTNRSSSPSSYSVSSTSDRTHSFSTSPGAYSETVMTGHVRKFEGEEGTTTGSTMVLPFLPSPLYSIQHLVYILFPHLLSSSRVFGSC